MSPPEPRTQNPEHTKYIRRCFELAQMGETLASPNPIVGCVIVHEGKIIAEGFHNAYGEAHAEVNAINNVTPHILKRYCDIYVSLEPCAHHGKTPPCADLIIQHGFKKLIFSSYDPNPEVSGKGIQKIKEAGIELVTPDDLEVKVKDESDYLNRKFFKWMTKQEAWTTLKIALSSEGNMLSENKWITNVESRKEVHRLRSTNDLIISGANSIRLDNSKLNVRHSPNTLELEDTKDPDICILYREEALNQNQEIFKLNSARKIFQTNSINEAFKLGYKRILVETGPSLSKEFLKKHLIDEVIIYQSLKSDRTNQDWQEFLKDNAFNLFRKEKIDSANESSDTKEIWLKTN